eukprot:TRINITY_DN64443_c0_g1_i1.p1 TRINITY_DN64443_c0_g1~~TRINITY_DN64443_c0_g1_i1.p1  ORF type:complete len:407 (-),score=64.44 TRINITY_DN64443_c0_g1_i1:203-1423(-)
MAQAAPDVNLQKQGLPPQLLIGVVLAVIGFLMMQFFSPTSDSEESSFWFIWLILWGVRWVVQIVVGGAFALLAVLVARQRSVLYVPVPPGAARSPQDNPNRMRSPQEWRLCHENLYIKSADGTQINAWFIYHPIEKCKDQVPYTAVYFHGNAGNIGHRLENIHDMVEKLFLNILIVDYRGYGDSQDGPGPTENGFMMDAMATYKWLIDRIAADAKISQPKTRLSADRILLFGRSIGGAVALRLHELLLRDHLEKESRPDAKPLPLPAGLVLENTFTSLRDMAMTVFGFLKFLQPLLRKPLVFDEWKSCDSLRYVTTNHPDWCCCLLSGAMDQIVPPKQMRALHGILKECPPKVLKFFVFPRGGHNDTPTAGGPDYWTSFNKFMTMVGESQDGRRAELEKRGLICEL